MNKYDVNYAENVYVKTPPWMVLCRAHYAQRLMGHVRTPLFVLGLLSTGGVVIYVLAVRTVSPTSISIYGDTNVDI